MLVYYGIDDHVLDTTPNIEYSKCAHGKHIIFPFIKA